MSLPVPRPPRILVMTTIPETLAAFFVPQLRALAASGFEVHVASSPGPVLDDLDLGSGIQRYSVPIERKPDPVRDLASLCRVYRLIRRIRPQIVHAHTPKAGLVGMAAAALARVPVRLYTVHGLPLLTRDGTRRRILQVAERTSGILATHTYSVSDSVRELLIELRLCPRGGATVLGDGSCGGVDVQRFHPALPGSAESLEFRAKYAIPADALVVSFVGRLARDKGIGVLAEAWARVAAAVPRAYLLLAGEDDVTDPVPESQMALLRSHSRVRFAGTVGKPDIPRVYEATDVAVLPTFREGLPQTALEAAAAGVTMVSTRVSGVVNAIEDEVTGILVEPREPQFLAEAIVRVLRDAGLRRRLGEAARARAVSRFSQERVNQLWMAEYESLVAAAAPRGGDLARAARLGARRPDAC